MRYGRSQTTCTLPGGLLDDGEVHRDAILKPLSGREEEYLADLSTVPTAAIVTDVLCRCVERIGAVSPVTHSVARRLLVGDRQYLLLKLRQATFGNRVAGTIRCPWPRCSARIDIDFSIDDVPITSPESVSASYPLSLSPEAAFEDADGVRHDRLTFRLPNGADQEAVTPHLADNPARALTLLLGRCIIGTDTPCDHPVDLVARLTPQARLEIEQALAARAPAVELEMDMSCPECGRGFTAPFHLHDFFFGELRTSRDLLYRQVHYLAYHYHWSEEDIMTMPRDKRLAYIDILADEIDALNDAVA